MAKLRSGNAYDLIFPTADYVNRLNRANMLLELDRENELGFNYSGVLHVSDVGFVTRYPGLWEVESLL